MRAISLTSAACCQGSNLPVRVLCPASHGRGGREQARRPREQQSRRGLGGHGSNELPDSRKLCGLQTRSQEVGSWDWCRPS